MTPDKTNKKAEGKQQKGATEDPPVDVTKQNKPGKEKEGSSEIKVPEEAVENYKKSGKDTEE